mmetsp:Transcript_18477/g.71336  ORF Transcript_18477/g.71336 Transcript_18477/m.71336 type:complete len:200 (-) Transcript_18477:738-1337(-)
MMMFITRSRFGVSTLAQPSPTTEMAINAACRDCHAWSESIAVMPLKRTDTSWSPPSASASLSSDSLATSGSESSTSNFSPSFQRGLSLIRTIMLRRTGTNLGSRLGCCWIRVTLASAMAMINSMARCLVDSWSSPFEEIATIASQRPSMWLLKNPGMQSASGSISRLSADLALSSLLLAIDPVIVSSMYGMHFWKGSFC